MLVNDIKNVLVRSYRPKRIIHRGFYCGKCGKIILDAAHNYCGWCGGKIDWSQSLADMDKCIKEKLKSHPNLRLMSTVDGDWVEKEDEYGKNK